MIDIRLTYHKFNYYLYVIYYSIHKELELCPYHNMKKKIVIILLDFISKVSNKEHKKKVENTLFTSF